MKILTFLTALLTALLSGMGVGSAGLFVVFLTAVGIGQLQAQGINLVFFLFCSGASAAVHLIRRRLPAAPMLLMVLSGMLFAVIGSYTAALLPEKLIRRFFGIMLLLSGGTSLFRKPPDIRINKKNNSKNL